METKLTKQQEENNLMKLKWKKLAATQNTKIQFATAV